MFDSSQHSNGLTHQHFILDAELKAPLDFSRRHEITNELINDLIKALGMEKLGPLEIYDAVDPTYPGWSFIQPITTSHISGHYFEEKIGISHIHMDVYSCVEFNTDSVMNVLEKYLPISKWIGDCIYRSMNTDERHSIRSMKI